MALCSVERTQLCKFGRGNPEEQFCEIVLNLDLWYGGDFVQKISYLAELSETQNYAYWYARFFPGTHDFR